MLSGAITNLLSNAWKYTRPVAQPVIEVGRSDGLGGAWAFYVRDNDAGFDAAQAPRLFPPFSRLHGDEFEGTGIALATVPRVMARHRGSIWADSAPGRGATFCFSLPRQARPVL